MGSVAFQESFMDHPIDFDDFVRDYRTNHPEYGSLPYDCDDAMRLTSEGANDE